MTWTLPELTALIRGNTDQEEVPSSVPSMSLTMKMTSGFLATTAS